MNVSFAMVDGMRMATLPAEDYERLIDTAEDRADVRAAESAEARRTAGEEYLPADIVRRMLAGESLLRAWRAHRRLTLSRLSCHAGIGPSYLSELELGKKPGTPRVWRKLANALEVSVDDIMPDENAV